MSSSPSSSPSRSIYRQHDRVTGPFATDVQRQLCREWVRLNRETAAEVAVGRWGARCPALAGFARPADVVDAVDAAPPERKDEVLIALVELAQARQRLAGRVLLQAMLPKLTSYAYRIRARGGGATLEDAVQVVLGEFWEVVSDYPLARRRTKVAANLALETWHRLVRSPAAAEIPVAPEVLAEVTGPGAAATPEGREIDADCSLAELLIWARARDLVSAADARLLTEVFADRDGVRGSYRDVARAYRSLAARTGSRPAALRQRVRRAKQRLAAAVQPAVQGT